jgi:bacterioferritin (cytochrome b1)
MQVHEVIFNLNKALQLEYSDVFLYPREAGLMKESPLADIFEQFGLMEIRHADLIARRIIQLKGKPVWDFSLLEEKNDLKSIIQRHIDYEERAISLYAKLIPEVDEETRILLRGIKAEEEGHLVKLKELSLK